MQSRREGETERNATMCEERPNMSHGTVPCLMRCGGGYGAGGAAPKAVCSRVLLRCTGLCVVAPVASPSRQNSESSPQPSAVPRVPLRFIASAVPVLPRWLPLALALRAAPPPVSCQGSGACRLGPALWTVHSGVPLALRTLAWGAAKSVISKLHALKHPLGVR